MDTIDPYRFIFAFVFVIGLIGLSAFALKRYGATSSGKFLLGRTGLQLGKQEGRVQVLETRYLDARRKLIIIRRDEVEHLLLLADNRELVIESWDVNEDSISNDASIDYV